jgi:hypothetical protein
MKKGNERLAFIAQPGCRRIIRQSQDQVAGDAWITVVLMPWVISN